MSDERRSVLITVPKKMKRELVRRARARGVSLNDVIVGTLANAYGTRFEAIGRKTTAGTESRHIVVRMDAALKKAIQIDAVMNEGNMQSTIMSVLATRLSIDATMRTPSRRSPFGGGRGGRSGARTAADASRRLDGTRTCTSTTRLSSH